MAGEGRRAEWLDLLVEGAERGHSPLALLFLAAALLPAIFIEQHYRDWFHIPDYERITQLEHELLPD